MDTQPDTMLGMRCTEQPDGQWALHDAKGQLLAHGERQHCLSARYQALRKQHGSGPPNLPVATLGGKQYWADRIVRGGWRIQQHVKTGHHRLLDRGDIRRAWGSYEHCRLAMEDRALKGLIVDYDPTAPTVILVHGIFRSKDSMAGLYNQLEEAGFQVIAINYPSIHEDITACADDVAGVFDRLPAFEHCFVVTHSMGGLVMRDLLGRATPGPWSQRFDIDRLCMLFPPNQGAAKADKLHDQWWYKTALGPAGQELTSDAVAELPLPTVPTAIIAGGKQNDDGRSRMIPGDDDGTVGVAETRLANCQGPLVIPVGHTFGMNDLRVGAAVISYLQTGQLPQDTAQLDAQIARQTAAARPPQPE